VPEWEQEMWNDVIIDASGNMLKLRNNQPPTQQKAGLDGGNLEPVPEEEAQDWEIMSNNSIKQRRKL